MGADIHMVLERRVGDKWIGLHSFNAAMTPCKQKEVGRPSWMSWDADDRNYRLFAELAGVRGIGPAPKGVPDDASDLARYEVDGWGEDGHSHTWYMLNEAYPIFAKHMMPDKIFDEREHLCSAIFDVSKEHAHEHRLIIWFDN